MEQFVPLFEEFVKDYTQEQAKKLMSKYDSNMVGWMFDRPQKYPSQILGEKIGLRIWKEWKMPFGWDETHTYRIFFSNYYSARDITDNMLREEVISRAVEIAEEMTRLNPEIDYDYYNSDIANTIHGMVSRFNLEDIDFFLSFAKRDKYAGEEAEKDAEYRSMRSYVEKKLGDHIGWVPSPETLVAIYNKVKEIKTQH